MNRRAEWRRVLDVEIQRLSSMPYRQLIDELPELEAYEVEFESKRYQVEVQLLENTSAYVHVGVSVDDGSLPASIFPVSSSFILQKEKAPNRES